MFTDPKRFALTPSLLVEEIFDDPKFEGLVNVVLDATRKSTAEGEDIVSRSSRAVGGAVLSAGELGRSDRARHPTMSSAGRA